VSGTEYAAVAAFPRRAIAVRMRVRQLAMLLWVGVLSLGMTAFAAWMAAENLPDLIRDPGLRRRGVATTGALTVRTTDHKVLVSGNESLLVFADATGAVRHARRDMLMFGPLAGAAATPVWFDPDQPERAVSQGMLDELVNRWLACAIVTVVSAIIAALVAGDAWRRLAEVRRRRRLARDPQPIAVTITAVRRVTSPEHGDEYTFSFPSDLAVAGRDGRQYFAVVPTRQRDPALWRFRRPLLLDGARTTALALRCRDEAVLLDEELLGLVLSDEERAAVLAAAARDRAARPAPEAPR